MSIHLTERVLRRVYGERWSQDQKWGEQNHPDVPVPASPLATACIFGIPTADQARAECQTQFAAGQPSWTAILIEEVCEAIEEAALGNSTNLVEELIQVAAVAVAWVEAIERR